MFFSSPAEEYLDEIEPGSKDWVKLLNLLKNKRLYKDRNLGYQVLRARWVRNCVLEARFKAKKKEMESLVSTSPGHKCLRFDIDL